MAYALSNNIFGTGLMAKFQTFADAWNLRRAQRKIFHRTYRELAALSDRELVDIGISRDQVRDIAMLEARKAT